MYLLHHTSINFSSRVLRISKILISACLCVAIITGCSETKTKSPEKTGGLEEILHIGLIPERNIFEQLERYEPLANYLSKKIDRKIKLKVLTRYGNIIDNFVSEDMEGAFFGSFTYALAHAKLGVEVLARPQSIDSTSAYNGLIIVRKDSGIRTAQDMKGKRFAFVDRAVTAGYLFPLVYLKRHGITNYETYFKEVYFAGTHENVIQDVLDKKTDIGAVKNTEYLRLAGINSKVAKELVVIEKSLDVPENSLVVKKDMGDYLKKKIKDTLLDMHNNAEGRNILKNFGAQRFIETTDKDYTNVYNYAKEINLNLSTYRYMNY